jgi:hypothetical protein
MINCVRQMSSDYPTSVRFYHNSIGAPSPTRSAAADEEGWDLISFTSVNGLSSYRNGKPRCLSGVSSSNS